MSAVPCSRICFRTLQLRLLGARDSSLPEVRNWFQFGEQIASSPLRCHTIRLYHSTCTIAAVKDKRNDSARQATTRQPVARTFQLWDSLSDSLKEIPVQTHNGKGLAWYTCGPTTYAAMHLGHARTYVWLDMMRRVLEWVCAARGAPPPLFVMNITDIDDKIIAAAAAESVDAISLARRAESNFWKAMQRLGCQRPHITTRVTEYLQCDIVPYIERLVQHGAAYQRSDGVYFDVQAFEKKPGALYGKLAGTLREDNRDNHYSMSNNEPRDSEPKRDKRDFALWKYRKSGEELFWPSPWGDGRPGWHIECSAMIEAVQQQFSETHTFLVHAGGIDLKFPHHTNEIAQAEAYHHGGCHYSSHDGMEKSGIAEWIPHWVHTGHLMIQHEKMSKSLKNFLTVDELWFDYDEEAKSQLDSPADDFRLWCLMGGPFNHREEYSRSKILLARQNREKILRFLLDGEQWLQQHPSSDANDEVSSKRWSDGDHALFVLVHHASSDAHQALLNNMSGTAYVEALLRIVEAGSSHLRRQAASKDGSVAEPIQFGLQSIRNLLALVGFSSRTVRAGSSDSDSCTECNQGAGYVIGGEKGLVQELTRFRSTVRNSALADVKSKLATNNVIDILKACDAVRDRMSGLGVEVMDSRSSESDPSWRYCMPNPSKRST